MREAGCDTGVRGGMESVECAMWGAEARGAPDADRSIRRTLVKTAPASNGPASKRRIHTGRASRTWEAAAEHCLAECAACARCRYVSVSLHHGDCSWYSQCDGFEKAPAFRSAAAFAGLRAPGIVNAQRE